MSMKSRTKGPFESEVAEIKEKFLQTRQFLQKKNSLHVKIMKLLIGSILVVSLLIGIMGLVNAGVVVEKDSVQIMNLLGREKVLDKPASRKGHHATGSKQTYI